MNKNKIAAVVFVVGCTVTAVAYAVGGLSFNNSQGIISVDSVAGTACIVGTASTCTVPTVPMGVLAAATAHSTGNVAASNTFQTLLSASSARLGCMITNNSSVTELIDVGASPAVATAVPIAANGGQFNCSTPAGLVISDQVSITSATVGATYVVWAQ